MGSTLINYIKVISSNKVSPRFYLHVVLTFCVIVLISPFQLIDKVIYLFKNKSLKKKDPIFIIGHWRSGTTLLHNLLCKNQNFGFLNTYNSLFINNIYSKYLLKTLMKFIMPSERPSDRIRLDVDLPQEDEFAVSNITNLSHYNFFFFPEEYKKFYSEAVRFENSKSSEWLSSYRKLLDRVKIYTNKEQLIIKNPSNTARIKYLLEKFPDAKFIHIYRNPVNVYLSTYKFFYELFPSVNLQKCSSDLLEKLILHNYREMYTDYYAQKHLIPKKNLIEIKFEDFKKDSYSYLKKIHSQFDLDLNEFTEKNYRNYLKQQKSHKMNTYQIKSKTLYLVTKEFKLSIKKMNYSLPDNLRVLN